jgi:2-phosphosulfolactate phosphatase
MANTYNSAKVYCEWGLKGIEKYKGISDVIIIVDVLSFSTSVDIALSNGAVIYPYKFKDETSYLYAKQVNAELASFSRNKEKYSISPESLKTIPAGKKLVIPSPNGSELSLSTGSIPTLCAGLRNSKSVAEYAKSLGERILVIPAGEKWNDGSIRFAIEDYIAAGSVISYIGGNLSIESKYAAMAFENFKGKLQDVISDSVSGAELIEMGFAEDVRLACELNVSASVPFLVQKSYINQN